ncbi:MAG: tetratricopeptide repeat protein [Bacteroidia bacterium]|nr:tetratricopeptide repeat protein [Bacteroidia bacterium]
MTTARKTQIGLGITAVVLSVLLFIAPNTPSAKKMAEKQKLESKEVLVQDLQSQLQQAVNALEIKEKTHYDDLLATTKSTQSDSSFVEIIAFWDNLKRPDFAAYFVEQTANITQKAEDFHKAGNRYYYAIRFIKDENEIPILYQSAVRCYQKAIEKDSTDFDAKIQLAACYVEGGKDPMQGITLLKELEKLDSNNVKLQMSFAFFSVQSQQWEKAIKRFEKVLAIDSLYIEAYLHLADAYEQQGNTIKTIEMLEVYASKTDDVMARNEIKKYIEQLKKQTIK